MSFFKSLTQAVLGKPNSENTGSAINKSDSKTFPVVYIERTKCHLSGSRVQVYCSIRNKAQTTMELDKIHILGTSRELDNFLDPGKEREFLVYDGPNATNDNYHELQLDYKDHAGDYFQAVHDIKFTYQANNKTYVIDEIHLRQPIRDING
jgi:hypothetical protein